MSERREQRGRPRTFDHDQLLERSVDVFWKHGSVGTTTRILESELEISQSSLYNAFGSKEGLLDETVARYETKLDAAVLSRLEPPSREALADFVSAVVNWVSSDEHRGCLILNLAAEDASHGHRLKEYRTRLRRSLRPAVRSFTADSTQVNSRTELLVAAVLGLNVCARSGAGTRELKRMGREIKRQIAAW